MELWDSNGNGALDGDEMNQCPGLKRDLSAIDADQDGAMSQEELQARLAEFEENATGLKVASFLVTLNGQPLRNAQVRLVPEAFLEGVLETATGRTNNSGVVKPRSESADLQAMQLGYYRVEVEAPQLGTDAGRESIAGLGVSVDPFSYGRQTISISIED